MAPISRVALAGKGRVGSAVVPELVKAGFHVTVLTRSAANQANVPKEVEVREVDYDSAASLEEALKGQDALVSTVAMSAIPNQKLLIDSAIAAGVKHFIPAEFSMSTRDPKAQWLPIYSTVLDIQHYLKSKDGQIDWTAVNCGAMMEFAFDYPFVLDFDNHVAALYDGGDNPLSMSTCDIAAKAIAGLLKQPERVQNHRLQVHGALLTQKDALKFAQKYSQQQWKIEEKDSNEDIKAGMEKLQSGAGGAELLGAMMTIVSAATFGSAHFESAYKNPDNEWLGIAMLDDGAVEEAIRKRVQEGSYAVQSSTTDAEGMGDVADGLVSKFNQREGS